MIELRKKCREPRAFVLGTVMIGLFGDASTLRRDRCLERAQAATDFAQADDGCGHNIPRMLLNSVAGLRFDRLIDPPRVVADSQARVSAWSNGLPHMESNRLYGLLKLARSNVAGLGWGRGTTVSEKMKRNAATIAAAIMISVTEYRPMAYNA